VTGAWTDRGEDAPKAAFVVRDCPSCGWPFAITVSEKCSCCDGFGVHYTDCTEVDCADCDGAGTITHDEPDEDTVCTICQPRPSPALVMRRMRVPTLFEAVAS
jgi:hypothetical protein